MDIRKFVAETCQGTASAAGKGGGGQGGRGGRDRLAGRLDNEQAFKLTGRQAYQRERDRQRQRDRETRETGGQAE